MCSRDRPSGPADSCTPRMSRVAAIANTPSLNASSRPVVMAWQSWIAWPGSRSAEEDLGFGVPLLGHQLDVTGRLGQRHADDVGTAQRPHHPERAVADRTDRVHAVPGGQHPVESGRRAAALDVAEHRAAGLLAGPLLDLL